MRDCPLVRDFRFSQFDAPIGVFLPDRLDWHVVDVSRTDLKDLKGSEVHCFKHWAYGRYYVRIQPTKKEA